MPETATHSKDKRMPKPDPRSRNVPQGNETVPRFAPSARFLGSAFAEEILREFRKELEGVKLRGARPKSIANRKP